MIGEVRGRFLPGTLLVRRLEALDGPVEVTVRFDPRHGPHRRRPRVRTDPSGLVCSWGATALSLRFSTGVTVACGVPTTVVVVPGRPLTSALSVAEGQPVVRVDPDTAWCELERDAERWRTWSSAIDDDVPEAPTVARSLLTLRLLTYSPSGAPVAAPTTSLPEEVGGVRNWDYRYAWPRDASIGVAAFLALDRPAEARGFLSWLVHATRLDRPRLPALLTLHGRRAPAERTLAGWPGYADSRPVRFGNGAARQHQLDGYGWVVDAAWLYARRHGPLSAETWRAVVAFTEHVAAHWREPDAGIWEERGPASHHVHSKAMAWLALDRASRLGDLRRRAPRQAARWRAERDALGRDILARGFDAERNTYTRRYGSSDLDAALLVLPLLGLEPPDSPRLAGTIDAIRAELGAGGPLLHRYTPGTDGLTGGEGAFLPCSFWCVQALAATGRVDEAAEMFAELVALASPLGLYAEEVDPCRGSFLGNLPQALTHAALVQAALALRDAAR
jgi:GH15 family glucan-1,4-alpha-glucosidase